MFDAPHNDSFIIKFRRFRKISSAADVSQIQRTRRAELIFNPRGGGVTEDDNLQFNFLRNGRCRFGYGNRRIFILAATEFLIEINLG